MKSNRKTKTGIVVSNKMDKTVVVVANRTTKHPLYKKYIKKRIKCKAHDAGNECNIGDKVLIEETRPLSKQKRWNVVEVLEQAL